MQARRALLLVEDDCLDATITRRCLKELNIHCEVVHKTSGEVAMEYLRNCRGDLPCAILLDLNMPRMSGIEFLTHIKADVVLSSIPVLVVTTSSVSDDAETCRKLGATEYIVKDCDWHAFTEHMRCVQKYGVYAGTGPTVSIEVKRS